MSEPETTTNPLSTSWETIPTTEHAIRTPSLPEATTSTEPETAIMEVPVKAASPPAKAASPPAIISPQGPYDLLIASAIQAARDGQLHVGASSPLPENSPAPNLSVPRHTVASIWPEPEAVSSAEADKDEGCGLKHLLWACVAGLNYICCMT